MRKGQAVWTYARCMGGKFCFSRRISPNRYVGSDVQWPTIKDFFPKCVEHVRRTAADNRHFVNGVFWVLRSGSRWQDLEGRYGKYKSVQKRFMRWATSWVWERVFRSRRCASGCGRDVRPLARILDLVRFFAHWNSSTRFLALVRWHVIP
jgi:transposase